MVGGDDLKRLQCVLTNVLRDIAAFCEKHDIQYFLVGGSAIGARRHGGFIPWDDDVDIAMCRQDYLRFIDLFPAEFAGSYDLHTPEKNPGYTSLIARVRLRGMVAQTREDLWSDEPLGPGVDIFVFENTSNHAIYRFLHGVLCTLFCGILACRKSYAVRRKMAAYLVPGSPLRKKFLFRSAVGFCFAFLSIDVWRKIALKCCRMVKNDHSFYVTFPAGRKRFFGDMYERSLFSESDCRCRISKNVDSYLDKCYGNWRELPAESDREMHFFCSFKL